MDNSNWTTGSTGANGDWRFIVRGIATNYQAGDSVLFDDTAVTGLVIVSAANVAANSTTVNNNR